MRSGPSQGWSCPLTPPPGCPSVRRHPSAPHVQRGLWLRGLAVPWPSLAQSGWCRTGLAHPQAAGPLVTALGLAGMARGPAEDPWPPFLRQSHVQQAWERDSACPSLALNRLTSTSCELQPVGSWSLRFGEHGAWARGPGEPHPTQVSWWQKRALYLGALPTWECPAGSVQPAQHGLGPLPRTSSGPAPLPASTRRSLWAWQSLGLMILQQRISSFSSAEVSCHEPGCK